MKRKVIFIIIWLSLFLNVILLVVTYLDNFTVYDVRGILSRRGLIETPKYLRKDFASIAAWNNCLSKMNLKSDVVFFGNSITCGSDFQKYFTDKKIINLGYGGNNAVDLKNRTRLIESCNTEKVFLMIGTNDLVHISVGKYEQRIKTLLDSITIATNAKIYVQSILPFNNDLCSKAPDPQKIIDANDVLEKICIERNLTYIDVYSQYAVEGQLPIEYTKDGVHLSKEGAYDKWATCIKQYIYE